jgi:hypothetical protein
MVKRTPVGVEVVDEADGRFVVLTYADGEVVREPVVRKKPARRPRRPPTKVFAAKMDRTRKKQY